MSQHLKILCLEDNIADAEFTRHTLVKGNIPHEMRVVENRHDFIEELELFQPDLVLSDHSLPSFDSMEAFEIVKTKRQGIPFILLTGSVSKAFAEDSLRAGVTGYVLKRNITQLAAYIISLFPDKCGLQNPG